jgi:hypothetical protein
MSPSRLPARLHVPPMWRVAIDAHRVQRWTIPACVVELPAVSADHAREVAVGVLHREAGAPPWRPLIRESVQHTTASPA